MKAPPRKTTPKGPPAHKTIASKPTTQKTTVAMDSTPPAADPEAAQSRLALQRATGATSPTLQTVIANQVINTLWIPSDLSHEQQAERMAAALLLLEGIKPEDEVERMLAAHMVATHSAAMECLRRAMISEQSSEGRDLNLRHAERLLATYTRQLEVLDKHRGKGQQQVTVKYVNVESGGQAVVGNVQSSSPSQSSRDQAPPALTDESGPALKMDLAPVPEKERARRR